jgi:hypothetical protein
LYLNSAFFHLSQLDSLFFLLAFFLAKGGEITQAGSQAETADSQPKTIVRGTLTAICCILAMCPSFHATLTHTSHTCLQHVLRV